MNVCGKPAGYHPDWVRSHLEVSIFSSSGTFSSSFTSAQTQNHVSPVLAGRRADDGDGDEEETHRYLLLPPHLSSPFLLPLCLLPSWLSWLF